MIAKGEKDNLNKKFGLYEFIYYTVVTVMFTCAGILILPFVKVYTSGISDVNYIRPAFAYIIVCAYAAYAIRSPYNTLTLAAGHYRQTRNGAFAEAAINVVVSVIGVFIWGIVGVALGTLAAMLFRTVQYAWYLSKNILNRSFVVFVKRVAVMLIIAVSSVLTMHFLPAVTVDSYVTGVSYALQKGLVVVVYTFIFSIIFARRDLFGSVEYVKSAFLKRKKK